MPGPLIAFWILIGFGGAGALSDRTAPIWAGVDPKGHTDRGEPARGFRTWTSAAPITIALRGEECVAVVFAVSLGQRRVRAQIDGQEQNVDWSWAYDTRTALYQRRIVTVRYLDPVGGAELACHEVTYLCIPENWDGSQRNVLREGAPCQ